MRVFPVVNTVEKGFSQERINSSILSFTALVAFENSITVSPIICAPAPLTFPKKEI